MAWEGKGMGWEGYLRRLGGVGREGNRKATSGDWVEWEGRGWNGHIEIMGWVGREGKARAVETGGVEWQCGARDSGDLWS